MKKFILLSVAAIYSLSAVSGELYRAPSAGDSGTYYVLELTKLKDGNIKVLTSRIGKGRAYTDFTELKINCEKMTYFTVAGSSEDGAKNNPSTILKDWSKGSKWTPLTYGSSKSDLVTYVCRK